MSGNRAVHFALPAIDRIALHDGPERITIRDARRVPKVVYRSVAHVGRVPEVIVAPTRTPSYAMTLVPLAVAAARPDIKYRREGFEMKEARRPARAVPFDFDDELALRCYS